MTREEFNFGFALLINAYTLSADRITPEMQEIYWQDLKEVPVDKFQIGVAWCRHHLEFFPSIAKLGSACYAGNVQWHESIYAQKRDALARKLKKLEPPMSDSDRLDNQRRVKDLIEFVERGADDTADRNELRKVQAERLTDKNRS